jgi:hypothetical protein
MTDEWKKDAQADTAPIEVPGFLRHPLKQAGQPDVAGEMSTPISASVVEEHGSHSPTQARSDQTGLYLFGIVRARAGRGITRSNREIHRVRYRDIEALCRPTTFELPPADATAIKAHQEVVESVMRRVTILPAPYGLVFKGRRPLVRLLQDQYLIFDEGLSLLEGHWELRLHVSVQGTVKFSDELSDESMDIYAELRRYARAAVTFASEGGRLMSAAFLVDRTSWVEFIERVEDFASHHKSLAFDVTGPWPAYDFVRIVT